MRFSAQLKVFKLVFSLFFCLFTLVSFGQFFEVSDEEFDERKALRKAQLFFIREDFDRAAEQYKLLADKLPKKFSYSYETALLYFYELDKKPNSIPYFIQAERAMPKDSVPQLYLYLGQAYQANGDYDSAINTFKYYRAIDSNFIKVSVTRYIQACELAIQLREKSTGNTIVEKLDSIVNSRFSEYTAVFLKEGTEMLFTARRSRNIYDELIEAIYVSKLDDGKFTEPVRADSLEEYKNLVMDVNEFQSVVGISPNGKELFIYYDPYIYSSNYENGIWARPVRLSDMINFNFVTTHASVTEDGKHIYFSCYDSKNTGNIDIYHSVKQDDGKWGPAERLPSIINTRRKEDSPEISPDGKTLYFASNGLQGMGRFDIYRTDFVDSAWTKPENLGAPINSPGDDIYFHFYKGVEGTLSSNRDGGYGGMDIYRVFTPEELPETAFTDCVEAESGSYEVVFDASESPDPFGAEVEYEWDFGDAEKAMGLKVNHFYKKPGIYKAQLNVIDKETGAKEIGEKEMKIEIKNVEYWNFESKPIVEVNKLTSFDASKVSAVNGDIKDIYWQVEPDSIKQGIKINHIYRNPGEYTVKSKVLYSVDDVDMEKCIMKNIKVLSKEDYENFLLINE